MAACCAWRWCRRLVIERLSEPQGDLSAKQRRQYGIFVGGVDDERALAEEPGDRERSYGCVASANRKERDVALPRTERSAHAFVDHCCGAIGVGRFAPVGPHAGVLLGGVLDVLECDRS